MPVRKLSLALCVTFIGSALYLVLHQVNTSINNAAKSPYMDEIFHIPQAQRYCMGDYSHYDPKLTTPPGLYLVSLVRIWIRDKLLMRRSKLVCDTLDLRRTNHLIAILNFIIIILIQLSSLAENSHKHDITRRQGLREKLVRAINQSSTLELARLLFTSLAITLLPPLFFFNSLYYTDAGSLLFTLITYLFSLNQHHLLAALFGGVAVLFRQTNIVWIFYIACLVVFKIWDQFNYLQVNHQRRRKSSSASANLTPVSHSVRVCYKDLLFNKQLLLRLVKDCTPYALVGVAFLVFLFLNGGIVLGDKEAHQPKIHLAQILYFLGFCSFFGFSWILRTRILKRFLYFIVRSPLTVILLSSVIIYIIQYGRYAHPYLLADNRHITFYIWRRILDRHNSYVPYLLTPVYLFTSLSIWYCLKDKSSKDNLLFIFCTLLVTVPNGLIELRYFIIPFVFLRLQVTASILEIALELVQYIAINIGMHYLFLHKTFHLPDSSEIQRIMW